MAKDYAKRNYNVTPPKKTGGRAQFVLGIVFIILVIGGYWLYLHRADLLAEIHSPASFLEKIKVSISGKKSEQSKEKIKLKAVEKSGPKVHFDFYTELPSMQVTVPVVDEKAKAVAVPAAPANKLGYIIQLGMFKDAASASELRLSLLLSGCEAEVVKVNLHNDEQYRVQHGPFFNMADAKKVQQQLEKKGIEGVVKDNL